MRFIEGKGVSKGVVKGPICFYQRAAAAAANTASLGMEAEKRRLEDAKAHGTANFTDVPAGTWYSDAVAWASENGIVKGTGDGFDPAGGVTREQLAAMLYRYAQSVGLDTKVSGSLDKFSDSRETSSWAKEALSWAVQNGLMQGRGSGVLAPQANITRAEAAAILERYGKAFFS